MFVLFNREYAHRRDGTMGTIFPKGTILAEGEAFECTQVFDAFLLFVIALEPYFFVGMIVGQGTEE